MVGEGAGQAKQKSLSFLRDSFFVDWRSRLSNQFREDLRILADLKRRKIIT